MNEEIESAPAEGEVLPKNDTAKQAAESELHHIEAEVVAKAKSLEERVVDAIEAWYAIHFTNQHRVGGPTLPSDDKALLIQHVVDAVAPPQE